MESACDESISRTRVMSKRVSANKPESYVVKAATQSNSHRHGNNAIRDCLPSVRDKFLQSRELACLLSAS
jgi:hypothetical protein